MPTAPRRWFACRLRTLFVVVAVAACLIGVLTGIERMRADAIRRTFRSAILEGRLQPEEGRWLLGDEVDQLAKRRRP